MTLEEYREHYNYAPLELHEFAASAKDIIDCDSLSLAASKFLHWKKEFENQLDKHEIEVG